MWFTHPFSHTSKQRQGIRNLSSQIVYNSLPLDVIRKTRSGTEVVHKYPEPDHLFAHFYVTLVNDEANIMASCVFGFGRHLAKSVCGYSSSFILNTQQAFVEGCLNAWLTLSLFEKGFRETASMLYIWIISKTHSKLNGIISLLFSMMFCIFDTYKVAYPLKY